MLAVVLLALGLAMDATAVSIARGLAADKHLFQGALRCALLFGGFQSAMSALGWALGQTAAAFVARWSHWIAFVLLAFIGGKMLYEARSAGPGEDGDAVPAEPFRWGLLFPLAVATSIDALAAGVTLPMLEPAPAVSLAVIGVVTAVCSAAGVLLGRRLGARAGGRLDLLGGLVLIGLGVKLLVDGLLA